MLGRTQANENLMILVGFILAALFFMVVLKWWAEGLFETSDAFLLCVVFCGLIFGLFAARNVWQFILAFVPFVSAGAYLIYSYKTGGMRAYFRKQCEEYMRAIEFDPRNLGAREYLAETLYNHGELDRAIAELQVAVNMGASSEAQYKLSKWVKQQRLRDSDNPVCRWCETENQPGARKCSKCGSDLPYDNALSRWLMGGRCAAARCWLLVVTGIAVASVSVLLLPPKFAGAPILLFTVALLGWSMISSARR
jgi:hypothetical protein